MQPVQSGVCPNHPYLQLRANLNCERCKKPPSYAEAFLDSYASACSLVLHNVSANIEVHGGLWKPKGFKTVLLKATLEEWIRPPDYSRMVPLTQLREF